MWITELLTHFLERGRVLLNKDPLQASMTIRMQIP